jgi:hypothetical protein
MDTIPAPEPYTLPLSLRIDRGSYIVFSVIFLLLIVSLLFFAIVIPLVTIESWIIVLIVAAGLALIYRYVITDEIRLIDDRICYREWFSKKEIEYTRITAVRYHNLIAGEDGAKIRLLEFSMDTGDKITLSPGMGFCPEHLPVIYDVLKKKAPRANLRNSLEEFFTDSDTAVWRGDMVPGPYVLPLTLRMDGSLPVNMSITSLSILAFITYFAAAIANSPGSIAGWMLCFLITAGLLIVCYFFVMPAVRLAGDRISYREFFFWKEMEYTRITGVRYYYRDTWTFWTSGPVLELSGNSGDRIAMQFGTFISPVHLPVIYDVLKKKAPRADLRNSPGVFFSHPDTIVRD